MRPPTGTSFGLILGIALVGICLAWLGPRPVYELWVAEELEVGQGVPIDTLDLLARATQGSDATAFPHLFVVDLDGDGDDDLIDYDRERRLALAYGNHGEAGLSMLPGTAVASAEGELVAVTARRGGHGLRWDEAADLELNAGSRRPPWADRALFFDADGDGDLDGIVAETGREAPLRFFMLLESGYRELSSRLGPAWTTPRVITDLACGDFNADGLIDLALAQADSPPLVLWNRFARN